MEFEGRITKVLPVESGTKRDGGEWKALPFIFEYYERLDDRWPDRVLLRARDPHHMGLIGKYVVRDKSTNKGIVENGCMKLAGEIHCRCGFGHNVNEGQRKDGSGNFVINELRLYKFELVSKDEKPQETPPLVEQEQESDDLPF